MDRTRGTTKVPCQDKYGGLSTCKQFTGVNGHPHEQNHSKKATDLHSLGGMGFDVSTFSITLMKRVGKYSNLDSRAFSETQPPRPEMLCSGMGLRALFLRIASDKGVRRARQTVYHITAGQPRYLVQSGPPDRFDAYCGQRLPGCRR